MKAVLLLLLVLLTGGAYASAQQTEKKRELLGSNAEGTRFFVGFMENELDECSYSYGERSISIASRFNTSVQIILPSGQVIAATLKPKQVFNYQVDRRYECVGEGVFKKGIEILSTQPISVYCFSSRPQTSDGYLALPVDSWGTEYLTSNYKLDHYAPARGIDSICSVYPRGGEFAILAAEDSTRVTVYPKTRTYREVGLASRLLMKGDIYQLQDGGFIRGGSDLTGSVVTSSKPVGLLSGHVRTGIPVQFDTKDHLIEMLPPRNALGKRYVGVPFGGRLGGDLIRVVTSDPGITTLTITNPEGTSQQYVSGLGSFLELIITSVTVITADKPVLVNQYSRSMGNDPRNDSIPQINFDPDMVVLSPEEQFVNAAVFQTLPNRSKSPYYPWNTPQFENHYVTIVAEEKKFETIRLNDKPFADQDGFTTGKVPGTPFVWATARVADGSIHVIEGDALFGGYIYGTGYVDSYAWPVGAGLRKFDVVDEHPPVLSAEQDCGGYKVTASDKGPFESGLRNAWIDTAFSVNVNFTRVMIIIGDEFSLGYVSLDDPRLDGKTRFIAEDLAGNRDTIEITLIAARALGFSRDSVALLDVEPSRTYRTTLTINNTSPEPVTIDSVFCQFRKQFLLLRSYDGTVIPSGGALNVEVLFSTPIRQESRDTLIVKSNCQFYRIPLLATMGVPSIGTHDLDFDTIRVGRERTLPLRVWNSGTAMLLFDSTRIEGDGFSIASGLEAPDSLAPGADTTLVVTFKPGQVGDFAGTIRFYSNADSVAVASLRGVAVYPNVSIGGYDFGLIAVGDTVCAPIPVVNTGGDTLHLTAIDLSAEAGYHVDRSVLPADLGPGDTLWVPVCFAPTHETTYLSDIFPQNSDGVEGKNLLRGEGYVLRAVISGYDWKERWVNTSHDTVVFLRNLSSQPLTIDSVYIDETAGDPGDFGIAEALQLPVTIAPNEMLPIKVWFRPLLPGLRICIIRGAGGSPGGPRVSVDSVLQGFGLVALASDQFDFDSSLAYSCGSRTGSITIFNDGNTPLTLSSVQMDAMPALVTLHDSGGIARKIPVGESLRIDFSVDLGGYVGSLTSTISWTFAEISDTIRRTFSLESAPQFYRLASSAPANLGIGKVIDLVVSVDSVFWKDLPQKEVELRIEHNPLIARFDAVTWAERIQASLSRWRPVGTPVEERPGVVIVRFIPVDGDSAALDSVTFPIFPFRSFLGNSRVDTFDVTMSVGDAECVLTNLSQAPYHLDSICALDHRLFELTGDNYTLKQNHPNPTGAATEIEFTIGMDAHTTLQLFAADGRLVRVLVDSPLATGRHVIPVDLSDLPSGLYLYRLISGPFNAIRQMIVAK